MDLHEQIKEMRRNSSFSQHNKDYWSEKNDKDLARMYDEGYGISEIAVEMGRTENSISKRIKDLKLDEKRYNTKPKKSKPVECLCDKCDLYKEKKCEGYNATGECSVK